jgi:hypothetical protein
MTAGNGKGAEIENKKSLLFQTLKRKGLGESGSLAKDALSS